jgi:hypothetical protein
VNILEVIAALLLVVGTALVFHVIAEADVPQEPDTALEPIPERRAA